MSVIPAREPVEAVNYELASGWFVSSRGWPVLCLTSGFILVKACGSDRRKYWLCRKSGNRDTIVKSFWRGVEFSLWMSEQRCSCLQGGRVKARTALDGKAGPVGDNHGRCSPALPSKPKPTCLIKFLVIPCQWAGRVVGFSPEFLPFLFFCFFFFTKVSQFFGASWKLYRAGQGQRTEVEEESPGNNFWSY